jgi:hypothetical protein
MRDAYDLGGNEPLGFVVIEINQASHQPAVLDGSFSDLENCRLIVADERRKTTEIGRRERYAIAAVIELDGEQ